MPQPLNPEVAIIGCGLAGISLAISLHMHNITCEIFEAYSWPSSDEITIGGSIALLPNGLRLLDTLGVYSRVRAVGFELENVSIYNETFNKVGEQNLGNEKRFGYKALRLQREELMEILIKHAIQKGIPIHFGRKFSHVSSETGKDGEVKFEFEGGLTRTASMLVGADGIHSTVRKQCFGEALEPTYTGQMGITWSLPKENLRFPQGLENADPITVKAASGFVLFVPNDAQRQTIRIGASLPVQERDRKGWRDLQADQQQLLKILKENNGGENVPDLILSAIEGAETTGLSSWPFYVQSPLSTWTSPESHGRIVIIGDAAHALPPAGGQGSGMAFEDGYTLALLLAERKDNGDSLEKAVVNFEKLRLERVDRVRELVKNVRRARTAGAAIDEHSDLDWLYKDAIVRT